MSEWSRAESAWLAAARRRSRHTARAYQSAMNEFRSFIQKPLGAIGGADVERYAESLENDGKSPSTVNARLSAVASFYSYCMRRYTVVSEGREQALADFNPVDRVRRARIRKYGKARHMTTEQVMALLELPDRSTCTGARDYAMILMALLTGRRSAEIRVLRWGEVSRESYSWSGKRGVSRTDAMPAPVWAAIMNYLRISGRDLVDEDPVFTSERYPHRPLSAQYLNAMVKRYSSRGLGIDWMTFHGLRHTAAYLRHTAGQSVLEISRALSHSSLDVTQIYLDHVVGQMDDGWLAAWRILESSSQENPQVPNILCITPPGRGAQENAAALCETGGSCDNQNYHN